MGNENIVDPENHKPNHPPASMSLSLKIFLKIPTLARDKHDDDLTADRRAKNKQYPVVLFQSWSSMNYSHREELAVPVTQLDKGL